MYVPSFLFGFGSSQRASALPRAALCLAEFCAWPCRRIARCLPRWGRGGSGAASAGGAQPPVPRCLRCPRAARAGRDEARAAPPRRETAPLLGRGRCRAPCPPSRRGAPGWGGWVGGCLPHLCRPPPLLLPLLPRGRLASSPRAGGRASDGGSSPGGGCGCARRQRAGGQGVCSFSIGAAASHQRRWVARPWIPFSSAVLRDAAKWSLPPALPSQPTPEQLVHCRQEGDTSWLGCWWHHPEAGGLV